MIGQYDQSKVTVGEQIMAIMYRRALMAPKAKIEDCYFCRHVGFDFDGVPDGCDLPDGKPCIRHDRRCPWWDWK